MKSLFICHMDRIQKVFLLQYSVCHGLSNPVPVAYTGYRRCSCCIHRIQKVFLFQYSVCHGLPNPVPAATQCFLWYTK